MPSSQSKSTSVFHALGSYADRIKEQQLEKESQSGTTSNGTFSVPQTATPSAASSSASPSPTATPTMSKSTWARDSAPAPAVTPAAALVAATPAAPATAAGKEEDGAWETVRVGRNKTRPDKQEEKRGSNSRNWREREEQPESASKKEPSSEEAVEQRRRKKDPTSKAQAGSSARQTTATATAPKAAWVPSTPQPATALSNETEGSAPAPATAAAAVTDAPAPAAPPATEAKPTTEQTKPKAGPADAEGSWRARPKAATPEATPAPAAPAMKKAAPPPAVNAWSVRKKAPKAAAQEANGNAETAAEPTPDVKTSGKKKKKHSGEHHHHHHHHHADVTHWPEVSQAAEAAKTEEKRSKHEKKESESSAPVEETPAQGAKKQKWMAIPAAELQEAADKAAESTRRQGGKSKSRAGKDSEGGEGKRKKGDAKKAAATRLQRSGSQGSEIRLPPFPEAQRGLPNGYRFAAIPGDRADIVNGDGFNGFVNGTLSAPPLSRQASENSKRASPSTSAVPLTPETAARELDGARGQATANGARGARGREREGRGGYGGGRGGRGGYRSASNASARAAYPNELSPLAGTTELSNLYQRGYGMGYNYYPVPSGGFVVAPPGYDAAQYAASMQAYPRGMPPPPLPITAVSNIDALRYYVLGQVEYYFSMQNLAMDFFLRQQMDSQGWIEVSMIASFNRIKSLTPDVSIVREVMEMSQLLEVKEDMVRLASDEAMRWVLPDAPPCKFAGGSPGRNQSPKKLAGEGAELSHGVPDTATASALGIEDLLQTSPLPKFDVENALMRNARDGSANMSTSSTASVLASDEGKTMTPETSIAGDSKSDFDVDEDIKIEQH